MTFAAIGFMAGLVCGGLGGWLLKRAWAARVIHYAEALAAAAAVESKTLRSELEQRKHEIDDLRRALREAEMAQSANAARAEEVRRSNDEQRLLLQKAQHALTDAFSSVAADALRRNNDQFLALAKENLSAFETRALAAFDSRQQAIDGVVGPVRESLERMDEQLRAIESTRGQAYAALSIQVQSMLQTQTALRSETANLVKALRSPIVRGRWGEIQLRRVVEIAGMLNHCDFVEQQTYEGSEGKLRPDLRVLLPGGKNIIVDAKAPLQAYLESLEVPDEETRLARLKDHARQVREHMTRLAAKSYWDHLQPSPDFVVLFLPGETFFSAALEQDPSLIEQGVRQRVILATPTTLIALLHTVAFGWRQERLTENAERISALGKELHDRLTSTVAGIGELGNALRTSVERYNRVVASVESRVLPAARRFRELGVSARDPIIALHPVDTIPRETASGLPENGRSPTNVT